MKIRIIEIEEGSSESVVGFGARDIKIMSGKLAVTLRTGQRLKLTRRSRKFIEAATTTRDHEMIKLGTIGYFDSLGEHREVGDFVVEQRRGRDIWPISTFAGCTFETVREKKSYRLLSSGYYRFFRKI